MPESAEQPDWTVSVAGAQFDVHDSLKARRLQVVGGTLDLAMTNAVLADLAKRYDAQD